MGRPDWDDYFLGIARAVAERSDCERSKVGAVVVKDRRIRATGYNGSPAGKSGCDTCPRRLSGVTPGSDYDSGTGRCVAVHAEANALLYCDRADLPGSTLYITREPCPGCQKLIEAAGIERVVTPGAGPVKHNAVGGENPYSLDSLWREHYRKWYEEGPPWKIAVESGGRLTTYEFNTIETDQFMTRLSMK